MQSWTVKSFKRKIIYRKHINTSVKQNHRHDYTQNTIAKQKKNIQQMKYYCLHWENERKMWTTRRIQDKMHRYNSEKKQIIFSIWSNMIALLAVTNWVACHWGVHFVYATASGCCVALKKVVEARLIMLCFTCTQLMQTIQTTYLAGFFSPYSHGKSIVSNKVMYIEM